MAGHRTPTNAKTTRCKATEGAQQCLKAEHPKMQNHTWGSRGETPQWRADGTPKPDRDHTDQLPRVPEGGFVDVPESPMDAAAMQTPATPDPGAPVGGYFDGDNDPPPTVKTPEARELLRDQPPTGDLLSEAQAKARERGDLKPSATVDEDDRRDMEQRRNHPHLIQSDGVLVRSDASEAVLSAGMGVIVPAAHQDFAITHAEESARVVVILQTAGKMTRSIADGQLVQAADLRTVYLKIRQMAATHAIDLDDQGGEP
jgi:hypothetical protein